MHNYAHLPTLVLNEIFGYLSVKERIICKSVCRSWKTEIELKEKKRDTLVFHLGAYLWNIRWSETNNRALMRFENSFQIKQLTFLQRPLTRLLLKKIKKLAIVNHHTFNETSAMNSPLPQLIVQFDQCEEIEIRNFVFQKTLTFDLPKLRTLVIKDCPATKMVLANCPSLEVLFWNCSVDELQFQRPKKLKRLVCFGWPTKFSSKEKFKNLEYLNLFLPTDQPMNDHLLELMPKLKRFVIYSENQQDDLEIIRRQQERCGLRELEILFDGFSEPVEIDLDGSTTGIMKINQSVDQLFDSYAKLKENSLWRVWIDYSSLFDKFKILPSNFFERFSETFTFEISEVTSYTHLFEFLRHYPFVQELKIHFSKVKASLILDRVHLLQPSLRELVIVEEEPSQIAHIDLTFMLLFNLVSFSLESTGLPVNFIRKLATKKAHFRWFMFDEVETSHRLVICFFPVGLSFLDSTCKTDSIPFLSTEQLIAHMQGDEHLKTFLLM